MQDIEALPLITSNQILYHIVPQDFNEYLLFPSMYKNNCLKINGSWSLRTTLTQSLCKEVDLWDPLNFTVLFNVYSLTY